MTDQIQHDEIRSLLPAAALGSLDAAEARQVNAHLPGCAECTQQLREYEETVVATFESIDEPATMGSARAAAIRSRLLRRASGAVPMPREVSTVGRAVRQWSGWLAAASLVGVLFMHHAFHGPIARGWLVAGILCFALVGVTIYAMVQRARVKAVTRDAARRDTP